MFRFFLGNSIGLGLRIWVGAEIVLLMRELGKKRFFSFYGLRFRDREGGKGLGRENYRVLSKSREKMFL